MTHGLTEEQVDDWIGLAHSLEMSQIDIHGGPCFSSAEIRPVDGTQGLALNGLGRRSSLLTLRARQDALGNGFLHDEGADVKRACYVLGPVFLHVHTRRVHIAGMTTNPDGPWMTQQTRDMSMVFDDEPNEYKPTHIVRDRDSKFTARFCSIVESDGLEFRPIPARSPNMNPFAESWVGRTKHEVLNHFIALGEKQLRWIFKEWLAYYHRWRPHRGLDNVPISESPVSPDLPDDFSAEDIVCHETLGGLLKHYERKAA